MKEQEAFEFVVRAYESCTSEIQLKSAIKLEALFCEKFASSKFTPEIITAFNQVSSRIHHKYEA